MKNYDFINLKDKKSKDHHNILILKWPPAVNELLSNRKKAEIGVIRIILMLRIC